MLSDSHSEHRVLSCSGHSAWCAGSTTTDSLSVLKWMDEMEADSLSVIYKCGKKVRIKSKEV